MEEISNQKISTRKILTIAIPLILQQLSLQMQVYVDRAMLGHVDSQYFSAVGNALVPYYAVTSIIAAICAGTTILIAQSIGAKEEQKSQSYAECSFIGNSIFPIIDFIFFFFASGYMFKLMGVQSPILEYSMLKHADGNIYEEDNNAAYINFNDCRHGMQPDPKYNGCT